MLSPPAVGCPAPPLAPPPRWRMLLRIGTPAAHCSALHRHRSIYDHSCVTRKPCSSPRCRPERPGQLPTRMTFEVKIKKWHAVASWTWNAGGLLPLLATTHRCRHPPPLALSSHSCRP